ncbi:Uncharacterized protein dnm_069870 [Desulfonema magnum]|uniref:Uncharacterized protein n=1 Tax=Desulfonema magnum TaxID=45655 RepID=A0A975BTK6_9BACT|nr:Uncharacterized protein dnm_069870 [Desulfonema magnum]
MSISWDKRRTCEDVALKKSAGNQNLTADAALTVCRRCGAREMMIACLKY